MSNTKLDPNPFTQALKDRKEGVLLGPVTINNLLKLGEEMYTLTRELAALEPEMKELENFFQSQIDNVEDQK